MPWLHPVWSLITVIGASVASGQCINGNLDQGPPLQSPQSYINHPFAPLRIPRQRELMAEMELDAASASASTSASASNTVYQNIRITPLFDAASFGALSAANVNLVQNRIVSDALAFWTATLQVVPISGTWFAQRNCIQAFQTTPPVCNAVETGQMCMDQPIPTSHFASTRVCATCPVGTNTCAGGQCSTLAAGAGVPNTDYVLYVRAVQTAHCGTSVLAYATSCQTDQYDRPTMGMVNFCPGKLNADPSVYDKQLDTATHEIAHALGFTSQMYAYMRGPDGNPRTPRDASGMPPIQQNYKCANGYVASAVQVPSTTTLQFFTERGHSVAKLVTPNVLSFARNYFNCPTLNGAEIEDQDGGCFGTHWEERVWEPELMSPLQSYRNPTSGLTLVSSCHAYFQDSGWYQVNFTLAQPMQWGANRGCPFATNACIAPVGGVPTASATDHFCTSSGIDACSVDLTSRAICTLRTQTAAIPTYDQYFSDATQGGASFPDFCPLLTGYAQGDCLVAANLQYPQGTTINLLGEIYGTGSFCLKSTLLTSNNKGWTMPGRATGCYTVSCSAVGVVSVVVQAGTTPTTVTCTQKGQSMAVPGFSGSLLCPDPEIVCSTGQCAPACGPHALCLGGMCACLDGYTPNATANTSCIPICPNGCSGNGKCDTVSTTCTCSSGFSGADCSTPTPTNKNGASTTATGQWLIVVAVVAMSVHGLH
ncbi:Aste57867_19640 [Aphanomyces stellatus]|uniref:Aste57867_19640 protein n=1 Tax=Aphanomyces stellatus TaxID=120398 RepID=A0A485LD72_9STRA|nr:hypothetical protein As57867_019575 [Aphanomyces stellatus]VFT96340.1 Aste57867_19640 [Aphanomyces stellatus]